MKWTGFLNYKGVVAFNLVGTLKVQHLAVYDVIRSMCKSNRPEYLIEGKYYIMISAEYIASELVVLDVEEQQIRRFIRTLEKCGLLQRPVETNEKARRLYVRLGDKALEFDSHVKRPHDDLHTYDKEEFDENGYVKVPGAKKIKNDPEPIETSPEVEATSEASSQSDDLPKESSTDQKTTTKDKKKQAIEQLDFSKFDDPPRAEKAWEEWNEYRRLERKGKYKTLNSQQVIINQKGDKFGWESVRFHAAILNSIGNLYQGIFEDEKYTVIVRLKDVEMTEEQQWSYDQFKKYITKHHQSFLQMPGGYLKYSEYLAIRECTAKSYMAKWINVIPEFMKRWCTNIGMRSLNWEKRSFYELLLAEIEKEHKETC